MLLSEPLDVINKRLIDRYGSNLQGQANYRVIFANTQFEKRESIYRDMYKDIIFLREVKEIREVPKYPYATNCYILELLARYHGDEVVNHNGYEPLFVFRDARGNPLDPIQRVIENILHTLFHPIKVSPADVDRSEEEQKEKEVEFMMQYMENNDPYIASMLQDGSAVTVPDMSMTKIENSDSAKIENKEKSDV